MSSHEHEPRGAARGGAAFDSDAVGDSAGASWAFDSSLADLWIMTALVSNNNDDTTCMRELIERIIQLLATAEHN
jgi:hypothetical protein